jgi:signal transduction histidine kinase
MLSRKAIFLYLSLMIIPTAIIAYWGSKMIRHEQGRILALQTEAIRERLDSLSQRIRLGVRVIQGEMNRELRRIPVSDTRDFVERLIEWKEQDPLVRCAFLHDLKTGLVFPSQKYGSTQDEYGFIARYDALISGRAPWSVAGEPFKAPEGEWDGREGQRTSRGLSKLAQSRVMARENSLSEFSSRLGMGRQSVSRKEKDPRVSTDHQWLPWFADNRLNILVWAKGPAGRRVWGAELEMMALLSRLTSFLDIKPPAGMVYALVDDYGNILHQTGGRSIGSGIKPDISVSLAPELPNWEIGAYYVSQTLSRGSAGSFRLLSSLSLAAVLIALVSGATLLTWQARRNMREALRKSSFVSNISHELKTPLTSIRMYAELLADGRVKDPEKRSHYLRVISMESQRLARLVNNALRLGRMEKGAMVYNCEDLDLAELTRVVLEGHRPRLLAAGLNAKLVDKGQDLPVRGDRDALEQVILNLLDNAIKYAAQGERLIISMDRTNSHGRVSFTDKGPGVPKGSEEKIFEKFTRLDDSLTTKQPGSGLGLTISRTALRDMGGDLYYEPAPGGGSRFVVEMPLLRPRSANKGAEDA